MAFLARHLVSTSTPPLSMDLLGHLWSHLLPFISDPYQVIRDALESIRAWKETNENIFPPLLPPPSTAPANNNAHAPSLDKNSPHGQQNRGFRRVSFLKRFQPQRSSIVAPVVFDEFNPLELSSHAGLIQLSRVTSVSSPSLNQKTNIQYAWNRPLPQPRTVLSSSKSCLIHIASSTIALYVAFLCSEILLAGLNSSLSLLLLSIAFAPP